MAGNATLTIITSSRDMKTAVRTTNMLALRAEWAVLAGAVSSRPVAGCIGTDRLVGMVSFIKKELWFQAVHIIEKSLARLQQQLLVLGVFGRTGHARLGRHDERRHFPRRNASSHFACLDPAG